MALGWHWYEHRIEEEHGHGVLQVAAAAPDGTPAEIVKQAAVSGVREVRWVAAFKANEEVDFPDLPAANQYAKNATLVGRQVGSHSAIWIGSGCYLYCFWGRYHYALIAPSPVDGPVPIGGLPAAIDRLGPAVKFFPASLFKNFLDTGTFKPAPARPPLNGPFPLSVESRPVTLTKAAAPQLKTGIVSADPEGV